jgi:SNF2 family DNA or RNA helicase
MSSIIQKIDNLNINESNLNENDKLSNIYNMKDKLYDHQKQVLYECLGLGSGSMNLVMGYGKSLISLVLALEQTKESKLPILIIVSKTLILNWINEIKKFFGDELKYIILHSDYVKKIDEFTIPKDTKLILSTYTICSKYYKSYAVDTKFVTKINERIERNGILVPHSVNEYNIPMEPYLQDIRKGGGILYSIKWGCLIIDEIQNYTNILSNKCLSLAALSAYHKWGLSGTLFAEPKLETIMGYFILIDNLDIPRRTDRAQEYLKSNNFKGYLPTTIYRDVIPNFKKPSINKKMIHHNLSPNEAIIYTSLKNCVSKIKKYIDSLEKGQITQRRRYSSYLIALITYLRQIIISPLLPLANCMVDSIDISNYSELSKIIIDEMRELNLENYLNSIESVKSTRIIEINNLINILPKTKIILFTFFRTSLDIMMKTLELNNRESFTITSKMTMNNRQNTIDEFKKTKDGILFLTYELGAEGINLQECDTVIFSDLYWNLAKLNQAEARVFRPGQLSENVNFYYFISNTAIEDGMLKKHKYKMDIDDEIKTGAMKSNAVTLSTKDIIKLLDNENNSLLFSQNLKR